MRWEKVIFPVSLAIVSISSLYLIYKPAHENTERAFLEIDDKYEKICYDYKWKKLPYEEIAGSFKRFCNPEIFCKGAYFSMVEDLKKNGWQVKEGSSYEISGRNNVIIFIDTDRDMCGYSVTIDKKSYDP